MENDILQSICEYLELKKIFFYRNNNTPIFDRKRQIYRKMPKYSIKGVSDIVGIYKGRPLYIEVKDINKYTNKDQKDFIKRVKAENGIAFVARSIEDVINNL